MKQPDSKPHTGMTAEALKQCMGEPIFVTREPDAENWIYRTAHSELRVRVVRVVAEIVESPDAGSDR